MGERLPSHEQAPLNTLDQGKRFRGPWDTLDPVDIVAILSLARSVEEEAPKLATDLGLTAYEVALTLRAPAPVVVLRTDDRARATDVVMKLRSRGHDVALIDAASVASSDEMFRPRNFRFEGGDFVGTGNGEEHRLPFADIFALVRAMHTTVVVDTQVTKSRSVSISRAVMTGGLLMTKATTTESKKIASDREPVVYLFRQDAKPWLLVCKELRYESLGASMQPSQLANFDVLLKVLRDNAPSATYDTRLLNIRPQPNTVVATTSKHLATTTAGTMDLLAHIVAVSIARTARPYR